MKKNTIQSLRYQEIVRHHRFRRYARGRYKHSKKQDRILLQAPVNIDLYNPANHALLCDFLIALRETSKAKCGITISFRDTKTITASGAILFVAEVDRLVQHFRLLNYPSKFKALYPPPKVGKNGCQERLVESILNQVGFFKILGMSMRKCPEYQNVNCWRAASGLTADGSLMGSLIEQIKPEKLDQDFQKALYRGVIEAISNSVEHAYTSKRHDGLDIDDRRWWMFTAETNGRLVVLVCDLGVGIPNTLKHTQRPETLRRILDMLKESAFSTDGLWIKAATLVKKTRTLESHRGKGGSDLRLIIERIQGEANLAHNPVLSIFSNKGRFRLSNVAGRLFRNSPKSIESIHDHKRSILGTIVEWSI